MNKELHCIPQNILSIISDASKHVANYQESDFYDSMTCALMEKGMRSPIEYAFYVGIKTLIHINGIPEHSATAFNCFSPGIEIGIQVPIDQYRADFVVSNWLFSDFSCGVKLFRQVVVECDGTAFHERTEQERRSEKKRDRHMQKLDMKVFRYTGKEILKNPYKIAAEVIGYVINDEKNIFVPII